MTDRTTTGPGTPITLAEIAQALHNFRAAVDREDVLEITVRAAVCTALLELVRAQLRDGAVLLSKADREKAFALTWDGALQLASGEDGEAEACETAARRLLQLED